MGNPLCHFELMVSDVEKSKAFYSQIFDWTFNDTHMEGYSLIDTGAAPGGGLMVKPPEAPACAMSNYIQVASVEETVNKITAAGGMIVVPRTEIPNIGFFAMFLDPDQICIGIFEEVEQKGGCDCGCGS